MLKKYSPRIDGKYLFESESGEEFNSYGYTGPCVGDSGGAGWKFTLDQVLS